MTAIAAVVGDDRSANAIEKAIVCALVFGVPISGDAQADFDAWRACRGVLADWHQARFAPPPVAEKPLRRRAKNAAGQPDDALLRTL